MECDTANYGAEFADRVLIQYNVMRFKSAALGGKMGTVHVANDTLFLFFFTVRVVVLYSLACCPGC